MGRQPPSRTRPRPLGPRRSTLRQWLLLAGVAAATAFCAANTEGALSWAARPSIKVQGARPVELDAQEADSSDPAAAPLRKALDQVESLRAEVENGQVLEGFGEKANGIIKGLGSEFARAVDGALYALFIQQLATVRQELVARFETDRRPGTAVERADKQFVTKAEALMRPGSEWSYEPERSALSAALESIFRQNVVLTQERDRNEATQRATFDVIGKLQTQMEQMGEKLRGAGAGSPWMIWTSYQIPGTPFRMSGRYAQGRTNIEFNLSPDKDPANAEGGFVSGLTPSNLGLSLNVGV